MSNPGDEPQQDTNPDGDIQDGKNFGKRRGGYQVTISYRGQGEKTEVAGSLWIKQRLLLYPGLILRNLHSQERGVTSSGTSIWRLPAKD